jgi:carbamoylphosphate synthase large subunit
MITIGVTAVGGGVGQSVLRALSHSHLKVRIVGLDIGPMSAGLYWVDSAYLVPPANFERDYLKRLLTICAQEGIDVLIPGSDPELQPLARNQTLFSDQGCKVIVGSFEVVQICRDKRRLYEFCRERNLPFIKTYSLN